MDGGGSSTACLIVDQTGKIVGASQAGPIVQIDTPGGLEQCRENVREAFEAALQEAGLLAEQVSLVALGMTGAMPEMEAPLREVLQPVSRVVIVHDSITALEGALVGQPGVVVIAGTGSVAFGRDADGNTARSGAWGPLLGDEGSGYWIGSQALSVATKAVDGRGEATTLVERILQFYQCTSLWDVYRLLHAKADPRPSIAALTRVVSRAAEEGDNVAKLTLQRAGEELAALVNAVCNQLEGRVALCSYSGGVFRSCDSLLKPFSAAINSAYPAVQVVPPAFSGKAGVVLLGLRELADEVDAGVVERLKISLAKVGGK